MKNAPANFKTNEVSAPGTRFSHRIADGYWALALLVAVLLVYSPALRGGFLWDDDSYISGNATLLHSLKGLRDIWFNPAATCQYYPLSFTGFWAGYQLWGFHTPGYHLANVFFHTLAAVLLWQVLKRLKLRGALLAGALFALHPVNVMSVAWMTEFKNTLSGSLALGAAWAWLRFEGLGVYAGTEGTKRQWRSYAVMILLFQLAMFAKTAVSFLPVSLLLIAWWQRGRIGWREIAPLLPLVGIVAAMGSLTMYIERTTGGASGADYALSLPERILVSGHSFWFYLGKLLFPANLVFFYPRWHLDAGDWRQYLWPVATGAFLLGLWLLRGRLGRGLWTAAMHFYVSTSMLVLMVVLYMMKYSFVSDHWQYFGTMSVMPVIASAIMRLLDWRGIRGSTARNAVVACLLAALGVLSWRQCAMYSDIDTLYTTTIRQNPGAWMVYNNLGLSLLQKGEVDESIPRFQKALEINLGDAEACNNLGNALMQKGELNEAVAYYLRALKINPGFAEAHHNLGLALEKMGELDGAIAHFQKAIDLRADYAEAHYDLGLALQQKGQLNPAIAQYQMALKLAPGMAKAHLNLGNIFGQTGQMDKAVAQYQEALEINPDYAEAYNNLGNAMLNAGHMDEAILHYQKALEITPGYAEAHNNLGSALQRMGRAGEAIAEYQKALDINPRFTPALNNLAYLLAACPQAALRNGAKAVELALQANQATGDGNPIVLGTLAAAYAENGQFTEAIDAAQRASELADRQANAALAARLLSQLALYQAHTPWRDNSLAPGGPNP